MASPTVLFCSVPDDEMAIARAAAPDAAIVSGRLVDVAAAQRDAHVLVVPYDEALTPELLSSFPHLRAIVTRSTGFDHLPLEWMREHGVAAHALGDYSSDSVAHFTVALTLMLLRRVPEGAARTRADSWSRAGLASRGLGEVTVGVLGTGAIGSRVVRLLACMGATVRAHDIVHDDSLANVPGFAYVADFEALLSVSDVLTLHVPLTEDTRGSIDAAALARLPDGAIAVNTARGGLVDQGAVEAALRDGRLAGYAADVMPGEPAPPDLARFVDIPNVVLTPHMAAYDEGTIRERYAGAARVARDAASAATRTH